MDLIIQDISLAFTTLEYPVTIIFVSIFLFLFGAVLASFTGLVVHRLGHLEEGDSVLYAISVPPSHCESCGKRLGFLELVPVLGWVISKGKCSDCGYSVPIKYPFIEALLGISFAAIPFIVGDFDWWVLSFGLVLAIGFMIAWIDLEHHIIPEEATWLLLFSGLLISPASYDIFDKVVGAAVCTAAMWLSLTVVGMLKGEDTHAGGDVAMAAAAGAWVGIGMTPVFLFATSLVYTCHAGLERYHGRKWTPMGPALTVSLLISLIFSFANFGRLL